VPRDRNQIFGGDARASQVPGEPQYVHALLLDPGGTWAPGQSGASVLPSVVLKTSAPAMRSFRGSITRPARSLSTLRRAVYPTPRKTRFRWVANPFRVGFSPAGLLAQFHVKLRLTIPRAQAFLAQQDLTLLPATHFTVRALATPVHARNGASSMHPSAPRFYTPPGLFTTRGWQMDADEFALIAAVGFVAQ
jgi:hypothetical protein